MGAVVLGAGPAHAFYFATYEHTKELMDKVNVNNQVSYGEYRKKIGIFLNPHRAQCLVSRTPF